MPALKRIGHKGADLIAPGNTLASFDAALAAGVDMVEFDVLPENPDRSGGLILAHDFAAATRGEPITLEEGLAHFAQDAWEGIELDVDLKTTGYERRVIDAPIAEMGFAGIGVGAAMVGLRPIVEFMTFNFSLVAIDQIVNNAAKIFQMSGGQYNVPIVFRGPGGPAVQVGSQHSQALESFYSHVPGLKVVMPSTAYDAKGLLKTAIRDDNPVVFIEGETLYNTTWEVPDEEYLVPLAHADVKRAGRTSR